MGTLRDKLIHHGASVRFIAGVCNLRLNATFRYKTEVAGIYDNLTREAEVMKVAEHQALYKYRK